MLELYAAGLTSEKETQQVEQWLVQYPEVAAEVNEITAGIEAYAKMNAIEPSPSVKEKILASIVENAKVVPFNVDDISGGRRLKTETSFWKIAAAASVILLIGSIVMNLFTYNKYHQANQDLAVAREDLNSVEQKNREMEQGLTVVQSKYSVPVALNGLEAAPDAAAKVFWMKNTGEVFIDASNLPPAPQGKAYQLWGIVDGKPVSGGMILTTKGGDKFLMQKMSSFGKAEAFAITLEPEKGNATPQGPMFVKGEM